MKLFNIDLHISVIADIKDIFNRIRPDIEIVDWSLSGHTWVFNRAPNNVHVLNQHTWQNLDTDLITQFQSVYDDFLFEFDGFIACHPNSFTLLFEKYNKPVIVINSCRYDMPFCWNKNIHMIEELHLCFKRLNDKNLLHFISNNAADNEYFRLGNPSINSQIIPSLCLYTNMMWSPSINHTHFLVYSGNIPDNKNIVTRNTLGEGYSWQDLMKFKGIIHIPYEASTMSIFEQLSSGIPLFFPSKEFLKKLWNSGQHMGANYWRNPPEYLLNTVNLNFWLERADYYNTEGIYYFNSFIHLFEILENFTDTGYTIRMAYIEKRKMDTFDKYNKILQDL